MNIDSLITLKHITLAFLIHIVDTHSKYDCPSKLQPFLTFKDALAFQLAKQGYDVRLANTRRNKYSCKHLTYSPQEDRYWKFGLDELVMIDVPATFDVSSTYRDTEQGSTEVRRGGWNVSRYHVCVITKCC
jgi:hypothetical protein